MGTGNDTEITQLAKTIICMAKKCQKNINKNLYKYTKQELEHQKKDKDALK